MLPIDTNYDSLQVYYDYLEDDGYETEELRESLFYWHKNDYFYEIFTTTVGRVGPTAFNPVVRVGSYFNTVGCAEEEVVGSYYEGVGGYGAINEDVANGG